MLMPAANQNSLECSHDTTDLFEKNDMKHETKDQQKNNQQYTEASGLFSD